MITIIKPGLLTTVQDLGRYGFQRNGVVVSGAMDQEAHRIANWLTGNSEAEASLEITLSGPVIHFSTDTVIALSGGDLTPMINGQKIRMNRPVAVKKDSELRFGTCVYGCRTYLAMAGGFGVPQVMNSTSTYLRAGVGGKDGRSLKAGDSLGNKKQANPVNRLASALLKNAPFKELTWCIPPKEWSGKRSLPIRVISGRHHRLFTDESKKQFSTASFKVEPQSDRMGYRLKGPKLELAEKKEIISEAVTFGTIQVPPEGQPIILMADRQTVGGYPKIAEVASVDLPRLAQRKPGDAIHFETISFRQAKSLYITKEKRLRELKLGISLKWQEVSKKWFGLI